MGRIPEGGVPPDGLMCAKRRCHNQVASVRPLVRTSPEVKTEFIGPDVHRKITVFSARDHRGENSAVGEFPTRREDLVAFMDRSVRRTHSHFVLEASRSTEWIYDALVARYGASQTRSIGFSLGQYGGRKWSWMRRPRSRIYRDCHLRPSIATRVTAVRRATS